MKSTIKKILLLFSVILFNLSLASCSVNEGGLKNKKYFAKEIIGGWNAHGFWASELIVVIKPSRIIIYLDDTLEWELCNTELLYIKDANISHILNERFFSVDKSIQDPEQLIEEFRKINNYYFAEPTSFSFAKQIYITIYTRKPYMVFVDIGSKGYITSAIFTLK